MKTPTYECDRCGACCLHLGIPVFEEDLRKEPKIALHLIQYDTDKGTVNKYLGHPDEVGCPLLENDGTCSIYQTKPFCCNQFKAGSSQCQWSRARSGLSFLQPTYIFLKENRIWQE